MPEFKSVKISNCMGFERRIYTFNKNIMEKISDKNIDFKRIRILFSKYGEVKEYNFIKKLIKLSSPKLEISFIMGTNQFTATFRENIKEEFENLLKSIQLSGYE